MNWLNIPFSAVGLIFSIIALVTARGDLKKALAAHRHPDAVLHAKNMLPAIAGVVCCAIAVVFGLIRLVAGGGLL